MVHHGLARETGSARQQLLPLQHLKLRLRHLLRLALQVLDATGGAPRVAPAAVQYVYTRVLLYGQDEPLALLDLDGPDTLYINPRQFLFLPLTRFVCPASTMAGRSEVRHCGHVSPGEPSAACQFLRFGTLVPDPGSARIQSDYLACDAGLPPSIPVPSPAHRLAHT